MSLLHEALRKAERARDEGQHAPRRAELAAVPLEIVAEPEGSPTPQAFALEPASSLEASVAVEPPSADPVPGALDKSSAPNPRWAFPIAVALAGAGVVAAAAYFWIQLRPAPVIAQPSPPRAVTAAPAVAVPVAQTPAPSSGALLPGLPPAAPAHASAPEPSAPAARPTTQPATPRAARQKAAPRQEQVPAASPITPPHSPGALRAAQPVVHPAVQAGYAAYQSADLALARTEYERALRADAANRDARLGIAAVESRSGRPSEAENHYRRLLQADPRDADAHAGLLALRAGRVDPLQAESRIKTLISSDPEASTLHFSLGNQYARQGRWDEAQLAYAKAQASDPENPDFAFNRAVSLDRLRQRAAALEHYRLALELAGKRSAQFPLDAARARIDQLAR